MRTISTLILAWSAMSLAPLWAADAAAPTPALPEATVTQLQVIQKKSDDLDVSLFNTQGIKFALVLSQPQRLIVGVDEDASRLISATDDKGTDLTEGGSDKWLSAFFSHVSRNRHKVAIPITLKELPAAGATTIHVKGEIVLRCGSNEKVEEVKAFDLAKGISVQCGSNTLKIAPRENRWGQPEDKSAKKQFLSAIMNDQGHWLKTIEFLDDQGLVIKSTPSGSMGGAQLTRWIDLHSDATRAGLRITYFESIQRVPCPVDLKFGVGLR